MLSNLLILLIAVAPWIVIGRLLSRLGVSPPVMNFP